MRPGAVSGDSQSSANPRSRSSGVWARSGSALTSFHEIPRTHFSVTVRNFSSWATRTATILVRPQGGNAM